MKATVKAPDGATHYGALNQYWYKKEGGRWHYFDHGWQLCATGLPLVDVEPIAPDQWNGEGLPPVGTVCELWYSSGEWAPCTVMAHDVSMAIPIAVVRHGGQCYTGSSRKTLRPIRTPEQIAAEERQGEISEIHADLIQIAASEDHSPQGTKDDWYRVADYMHDRGYRKQVAQ